MCELRPAGFLLHYLLFIHTWLITSTCFMMLNTPEVHGGNFCYLEDFYNQQNLTNAICMASESYSACAVSAYICQHNGQSNTRGKIMQPCLTFIYYQIIHSSLHWLSCACCTLTELFLLAYRDTSRCFRVMHKEICHVISVKYGGVFKPFDVLLNDLTFLWKTTWQVNSPGQNPGFSTTTSSILFYMTMWKFACHWKKYDSHAQLLSLLTALIPYISVLWHFCYTAAFLIILWHFPSSLLCWRVE